jgi:hypothetical protein
VAIFFSSIFVSPASFGQQQDQINLIKSTQQQTKPDQPSNKQPKKFYGHFRSGRSVTVEGGHRRSRRSRGGWASPESQIVGVVVVGGRSGVARGHPRAFASHHWGWREATQSVREPPQREERWPRAAPYGSEVAALCGRWAWESNLGGGNQIWAMVNHKGW